MPGPRRSPARWARAAAFGTTGTLLGLGSHVIAGGAAPSVGAVAAAALVPAVAGFWLAGRERRFPVILAALAAVQVLLHETFMAAAAPACAIVPSGGASGDMVMAGASAVLVCPATAGMSHAPMAGMGIGWSMLAWHAAAVIVTALLLARAEAAAWVSARLVARMPRPLSAVAVPAPQRPARPLASGPTRRPAAVALSAVSRRGPPARGRLALA